LRTLEVVQVDRCAPRNERRRISVDILRIVLAIILPPLGVFLQVGLIPFPGEHSP
jgi:Proteolipid membrane potential modulator